MAEGKIIPLKEVEEHNKRDGVWFVIHNKVYDVTKFLEDHPGGEEVLLEQAGKNATEIFEDVSHSADAKSLMKDYCIGELGEHERFAEFNRKSEPAVKFDMKDSTTVTWSQWAITIGVSAAVALIVRSLFLQL